MLNSNILLFFQFEKNELCLIETKIIHLVINTISMREKYSFIGYHWIYGHSTRGVSKSCKTLGKPRVLHDFDTPRVDNGGMALYSMAAYERALYYPIYVEHKRWVRRQKGIEMLTKRILLSIFSAKKNQERPLVLNRKISVLGDMLWHPNLR